MTKLHLDAETGDSGAVAGVALGALGARETPCEGISRVTVTVVAVITVITFTVVFPPLLLYQEAVEILYNVLVLANFGEVLHLLKHLVQILLRLDLDLLDCKDPVVKLVLDLVDLPKVA